VKVSVVKVSVVKVSVVKVSVVTRNPAIAKKIKKRVKVSVGAIKADLTVLKIT
jgi:hypothetical protein